MPTVDPEGRIAIPTEIRERLGLEPGSEVDIYEEDGKVVVAPGVAPEEIIKRMEEIVAETASNRGEAAPINGLDPEVQRHREVVRQGAEREGGE